MSTDKNTIALLGTGRMGAPIARNLLSAQYPVRVWNRTEAKARPLAAAGASVALTPAAAADGADVLVTMLADGAATERAVAGTSGALETLAPGATWVQMGTIGLDWTRRLAARAQEHEIAFVDAPVSGSDGPARDGTLVILASGDQASRDRLYPIFDVIGRRTWWLGPAGHGSALKLVLNGWLASITEAAAEGVALSEALDLDPRLFADVLADLPLGAPYAIAKINAMIARRFEPGFALEHAHKDVALAVSAAAGHGLHLPVLELVDRQWDRAIAAGHGDQDVAVVSTLHEAVG
jgi:3-hydroxyisobutyrate dehydrogenase